jgi:UDP-N-acetylmuramyl pentapeptide phosphotransferase/UDP-N-acetylglucosamine-1-phosphate transferase
MLATGLVAVYCAPLLTALGCFVGSAVACELVRRVALRAALLDQVNERSLHTVPTPRLGGVAIVAMTLAAMMLTWSSTPRDLHVVVGVSAGIALVGLRDDLRPMSAGVRIALQIAAAIARVRLVGTPALRLTAELVLPLPAILLTAVLVVWIVGVLNIYNFMDGMDGLAGAQTVSASVALALVFGVKSSLSTLAVALGGSALGFLVHNYPPARLFMGDAGSTFIGMCFAALGVIGMNHDVPLTQSALPLAPFLLDGTFTIFRRGLRKEKIWKAHRSHLYQRAVQTGLGHRTVLLVYLVWLAVAAAGAVLSSLGTTALLLAWVAVLGGLVVVWRWVRTSESRLVPAQPSRATD